jgi:type IV secretory pathway protease TraF
VGADEIWLFSPHPRSFDSRYFGPIAVTEIRGILHPFVVVHRAPLLRWASLLRACGSQP